MSSDVKQRAKELKAKRKSQRALFQKRINSLFRTEYRYSLRFEEAHVFNDGKAYINVDLTKVDTPFSPYSYDNRINPEIYDYINQETEYLPADIPVVINFDDDGKYDNEMRTKIKKAVVRHYSLEYEEKRYELRRSRIFGFISLLIGVLFMMIYIGLNIAFYEHKYSIFADVLNIVSWAFIWESVDRFAITGVEDTGEVFNAGQLALVEVQFGKPKIKTNR